MSTVNNAVERLMLRRFGVKPVVHSSSVLHDLAKWSDIPEGSISKIPIGIDTNLFGPREDRTAYRSCIGVSEDEIVITYVARLVESKNPQLFVRAAASVLARRAGIRFLLIGDGPKFSTLKEAADAAGLEDRLLLLDRVEDVSQVLGVSDIFVSTSSYEGFGIAVLEAMASGLPVVTTAAGGVQDLVVTNETGFVTPLDDVDSLVTALLTLVDDVAMKERMGAQARDRAQRLFDTTTMLRSYEQFYRHLASMAK